MQIWAEPKKSTLPIFKCSMLFLDKLLIQKEINFPWRTNGIFFFTERPCINNTTNLCLLPLFYSHFLKNINF